MSSQKFHKKDVCFFTVSNLSYLNKALALSESLFATEKKVLKIYLFEEDMPSNIDSETINYKIYLAKDLDIDDFYSLAFKYDVVELTTALKPFIALSLLKNYSKVIFLDPDTYVYSKFDVVREKLNKHDVVLTSHYNDPENSLINPDLAMMRFGSYNLGFFAVNDSLNSLKFLKWWDNRCQNQCFFESQFGLSTDQKWVAIAPAFFDFLYTLRDDGYNVSYWNLKQRKISEINGNLMCNNDKLVFFHYSSFNDSINLNMLSSRSGINLDLLKNPVLNYMVKNYRNHLNNKKFDINLSDKYIYSYDIFFNKYFMNQSLRRSIVNNSFFLKIKNPFKSEKIHRFAKANNLISKFKPLNNSNQNHLTPSSDFLIKFFLKSMHFVFGVRRSNNISRLFVYMSSPYRIKNYYKNIK